MHISHSHVVKLEPLEQTRLSQWNFTFPDTFRHNFAYLWILSATQMYRDERIKKRINTKKHKPPHMMHMSITA